MPQFAKATIFMSALRTAHSPGKYSSFLKQWHDVKNIFLSLKVATTASSVFEFDYFPFHRMRILESLIVFSISTLVYAFFVNVSLSHGFYFLYLNNFPDSTSKRFSPWLKFALLPDFEAMLIKTFKLCMQIIQKTVYSPVRHSLAFVCKKKNNNK